MQASRRELLDDFLDFIGEPNDSNARNTAERLLNRALHAVWLKHPWKQLLMPVPFTLTTVAHQRHYVLPPHFGRVAGGLARNITKANNLQGLDPKVLQFRYPDSGTPLELAADPEYFTVSGTCGVHTLLAAPSRLMVTSDVPTDTQTVVAVEGMNAAGRWVRQQTTLVGTTQVVVSGEPIVPWMFGKALPALTQPGLELTSSQGTVSLWSWDVPTASGAELQTLQVYESAVEQQVLILYPKPALGGDLIAVPYLRALARTLYDADPVPNHWQDAVFEEMVIQWRVNTGELSLDTLHIVRPKFLDLLAFEQANRLGSRPATHPFLG